MDRITQTIEAVRDIIISEILTPIRQMNFTDILDVLLLTVILYMIIQFVSNRRAGKLALGCILIIAVFVVAEALEMHAMRYILSNFYQVGFIAIIIIFQDELRAALEKVGGISSRIVSGIEKQAKDIGTSEITHIVDEIVDAVFYMSKSATGALIVIEQDTKIGEFISGNAIVVDAQISSALLQNIFVNKTPLHDGAVMIRDFRIAAAGCRLPGAKRFFPVIPACVTTPQWV